MATSNPLSIKIRQCIDKLYRTEHVLSDVSINMEDEFDLEYHLDSLIKTVDRLKKLSDKYSIEKSLPIIANSTAIITGDTAVITENPSVRAESPAEGDPARDFPEGLVVIAPEDPQKESLDSELKRSAIDFDTSWGEPENEIEQIHNEKQTSNYINDMDGDSKDEILITAEKIREKPKLSQRRSMDSVIVSSDEDDDASSDKTVDMNTKQEDTLADTSVVVSDDDMFGDEEEEGFDDDAMRVGDSQYDKYVPVNIIKNLRYKTRF